MDTLIPSTSPSREIEDMLSGTCSSACKRGDARTFDLNTPKGILVCASCAFKLWKSNEVAQPIETVQYTDLRNHKEGKKRLIMPNKQLLDLPPSQKRQRA